MRVRATCPSPRYSQPPVLGDSYRRRSGDRDRAAADLDRPARQRSGGRAAGDLTRGRVVRAAHGHVIVPLATPATVQPLLVQIALKALNSLPRLGLGHHHLGRLEDRVTSIGTSAALTTALPEPAEPAAPLAALPLWFAVLLPPPQTARVAAPMTPRPTMPTSPMTIRRSLPCVAPWSAAGNWSGWLTMSSKYRWRSCGAGGPPEPICGFINT
jgi:hypothetical protein